MADPTVAGAGLLAGASMWKVAGCSGCTVKCHPWWDTRLWECLTINVEAWWLWGMIKGCVSSFDRSAEDRRPQMRSRPSSSMILLSLSSVLRLGIPCPFLRCLSSSLKAFCWTERISNVLDCASSSKLTFSLKHLHPFFPCIHWCSVRRCNANEAGHRFVEACPAWTFLKTMWAQLNIESFGRKGLDLWAKFFISFRLDKWEGAWFNCLSWFVIIQEGWTREPNTALELGCRYSSSCQISWIELCGYMPGVCDWGVWTLRFELPCWKHTRKIFLWSYRYNQARFYCWWKTSQHPLLHQSYLWWSHIAPRPMLQHKVLNEELCVQGEGPTLTFP